MSPKAKQTTSLEKLFDIGKATLGEPNSDHYMHDDVKGVVSSYIKCFLKVAPETKRLNPVSVSQIAKELFQMKGN